MAHPNRLFPLAWAAYLLIGIEILYMISPFALYYYGVYGPSLNFLHQSPLTAWLTGFFLPHYAHTTSALLNALHALGGVLFLIGLGFFFIGAFQIYRAKFTGRGAVTGGLYSYVRNPQYTAFAVMGFGLLLVWPRFTVLIAYVSMLFVYYFLARYEERECTQKFGAAFTAYASKTPMFLPWRLPVQFPALPSSGLRRALAVTLVFIVAQITALMFGFWLREIAISRLSAVYTPDTATLAVAYMSADDIEKTLRIALDNPRVHETLTQAGFGTGALFLNYIVPASWHLPDLPMEKTPDGIHGHHQPKTFDADKLKILFTSARTHSSTPQKGPMPTGKTILKRTHGRDPIVLVYIDRSANQVLSLETPPAHVPWGDIPTPLF